MRTALGLLILGTIVLVVTSCGGSNGDDAEVVRDIVAASSDAKMLYENDYVTVVEFEVDSGDRLPGYAYDNHTVYTLSNYEMELRHEGERSKEKFSQGSAYWREAGTYSVKNVGKNDAKYIALTRKHAGLPDFEPVGPDGDVTSIVADNTVILLSNECVRVIEVILNPGQRLPGHDGVNRIVYSLTSYELEYRSGQMDRSNVSFDEGDVNWYEAGQYSVANISDSPARFIIFEFLE
jgi:hypothetical protein